MNPGDMALQALTPTVMVPRFEAHAPLVPIGHRFLATADGLWMEIRRAWLYVCLPVALQDAVPMPYGTVKPVVEYTFGKVPKQLLDEFVEMAKAALPNEAAAAVIWDEATGNIRLQLLEANSVSPVHIDYKTAELDEGEHLVMDLHSHGHAHPHFSRMDDADDATAIRVAGVVGNLNKATPTYAFRLCVLGRVLPL